MAPRRLCVAGVATLLTLVVVLAGCGGGGVSRVLDGKETGRQIADHLASTLAIATPAVTCPNRVKAKAHQRFDCHTTLEGQPLTLHVALTDDDGHFTPTPAAAVIMVAKIAGAIQGTEAKATVRCGQHTVLVEQPRATFDCTAATATGPVTYRVTVKDLAGNVGYQPIKAQAG